MNMNPNPEIAEEIRKALDSLDEHKRRFAGEGVTTQMDFIINAPTWLHALLAESDHWQQCFIDANRDWARVGNELLDERNKTDELTAQLTEARKLWGECEAQNQQLREELSAKDKVLEWYGDEDRHMGSVPHYQSLKHDGGERARSILSQYMAVKHET